MNSQRLLARLFAFRMARLTDRLKIENVNLIR
jgi:hypothetical protein